MTDSGYIGIDFNNVLNSAAFIGMVFVKMHSLASFFGISGFKSIIFRKFS